MTVHVLVEGSSERVFFERWGPRLVGNVLRVHPHQGKGALPEKIGKTPDPRRRGLLDQLPAVLRGLAGASDHRIDGVLVMVDADSDDALHLAASIMEVAKSSAPNLNIAVSVAIEEMEAFYLGDLRALARAFPNADMDRARAYVPDSICGTWELFGEIVGDDGANKVSWAETMGPLVTTIASKSRSPSFRNLVSTLSALATPPKPAAPKARARRHRSAPAKRRGST